MTEAFAAFLFDQMHGVVYAAISVVGVSALLLVLVSFFKDLFGGS